MPRFKKNQAWDLLTYEITTSRQYFQLKAESPKDSLLFSPEPDGFCVSVPTDKQKIFSACPVGPEIVLGCPPRLCERHYFPHNHSKFSQIVERLNGKLVFSKTFTTIQRIHHLTNCVRMRQYL